ncbi:Holliday junction branch migration protein RuvA [bacterium]|nr:Holliday junction branch migration protein RuvA [bacterium]
MIGYLKGKVLSKSLDASQCVILSHRVGYELTVTASLFDRLAVGDSVSIWVHTHVREDILSLYGFATEPEKSFFRLLLTVSGLGPKSSMALLSEHGAERLAHHIRGSDANSVSSAPGIGKKLAQKIILELQPKMDKLAWLALSARPLETARSASAAAPQPLRDDLASALLNLGFAPQVVKPTVERIFEREDAEKEGFEACLRMALKEMAGRPLTTEGGARG